MKNKPMAETANSTPNVSSRSHLEERVPRLRFPGFEGEWKGVKLGRLGCFTKGAPLSKADISGEGTPFVLYGELYTTYGEIISSVVRKTRASVASQYLSKQGDVIIPTSGETPEEIATASCVMIEGVVLGGDLNIFRSEEIDGRFLAYQIRHNASRKIARIAQGVSIVHISASELKNVAVIVPERAEQHRIVELLASLDSRIDSQRRLVELLKKHKRGLLRKVFEECAEGDRRAFCEIASRRTEKISPSNDSTLDCIELEHIEPDTGLILGSVPLREQSSLKNRCRPNDIIFGKLRPYLRKFVFAESECAASSETWVLTAASGINPRFLFYLIQSEPFMRVANISSGTKMPRSEWPNVANAQFAIPSQSRQQTIADCFTAIDMRIQDAQKTFLAMQAYKRGLLQQLFV